MTIKFEILDKRYGLNQLGYIPDFLSYGDLSSAKEQFNRNYKHGGGWNPFEGFTLNTSNMQIQYNAGDPEETDPPYEPIAKASLRDEEIYVYPHAWVLILQKNGTYEICRMD
jgi:hypothetical protein